MALSKVTKQIRDAASNAFGAIWAKASAAPSAAADDDTVLPAFALVNTAENLIDPLVAVQLPAALTASGNLKIAIAEISSAVRFRATTGTQSNVSGSASDVTILASNANRMGATVTNDSTAILYLLLANATSSTTVHTVQLGPGDYYEVPFGYSGVIKGIWASATGSARVTELT